MSLPCFRSSHRGLRRSHVQTVLGVHSVHTGLASNPRDGLRTMLLHHDSSLLRPSPATRSPVSEIRTPWASQSVVDLIGRGDNETRCDRTVLDHGCTELVLETDGDEVAACEENVDSTGSTKLVD